MPAGSTQRLIAAVQAQDALDGQIEPRGTLRTIRERQLFNQLRRSLKATRDAAVAALDRDEAGYFGRYCEQDDAGKLATYNGLLARHRDGIETIQITVHHDAQDCPGFVETFRVST